MYENTPPFPFLSETAMILAAGFGARMKPLTDTTPKPLLPIHGRAMLDIALDHLKGAGVRRVIVNGHYLADQIKHHLAKRHDLETVFLFEPTILDTGGGVKNALPYFGDKPFFLLGGDMPWFDGNTPALHRLAAAWNPDLMDDLLLVAPTKTAHGFGFAQGDFMMNPQGLLRRKNTAPPRDVVFLSAQIIKPSLYDGLTEIVFSNNLIFDRAERAERLCGLIHDGTAYHVGTPEDWREANRLLESGKGWG